MGLPHLAPHYQLVVTREGRLDALMEYLRSVREGEAVEAFAEEVHWGRRVALYRVEVGRAGERVALFTGWVVRRETPVES